MSDKENVPRVLAIDRIEEGIAVCEELIHGSHVSVPAGELPKGAAEGDILVSDNAGYTIDPVRTQERKKRAYERLRLLRRK